MIYPSLFIGLGTTGLQILEHLQRLVIEEYGSKPPVFEYLYFETDERKKPEVQPWAISEISMPDPFPVVKNLGEIESDFYAGKKKYLEDWLNPEVLKYPKHAFTGGAGHIRMAGRLCLWENWETCTQALASAKAKITAQNNIGDTVTFLRGYYNKVGKKIKPNETLVGVLPNVYIVGTLCGGTCGGMLIDIAYYIRHLFELWAMRAKKTAKVQGIFTIYDSDLLLKVNTEEKGKRAANCWASLVELDYYNHPDSKYAITFPDGTSLKTREPPLDYIYLLSCSADGTNLRTAKGKPDIDALNHMAAMVLFSETVSDLFDRKENIRINSFDSPRVNTPNEKECLPCFTGCGMAAVWYPKYRIAEVAACLEGKKICEGWIGSVGADTELRIQKDAGEEWEKILEESLPTLTHKPGGSIEDELRKWFENNGEELLKIPFNEMKDKIRKELEKLEEEEEYDQNISRHLREFERKVKRLLKTAFESRINNTKNLTYVEHLLKRLDSEIEVTINSTYSKYSRPDLSNIKGRITSDMWSRLVMLGKKVSQQKKEEFIDNCLTYFLDSLVLLRNYRARTILEKVRKYLGVGLRPSAEEARVLRTLNQELGVLKTRLQNCRESLKTRASELSAKVVVPQNMRVIYNNDQDTIEEDIKDVSAKFSDLKDREREVMLDKIMTTGESTPSLYELLSENDKDKGKIIEAMITELRLRALAVVGKFNIAEKFLERIDAETLRHFARRALPHLESAGKLPAIENPHFMMGKDDLGTPNLNRLSEPLSDPTTENRIDFGVPVNTPLIDHLLLFYKEQGLLYRDENLATSQLFEKYYEEVAGKSKYGLHTHKCGPIYFDPRVALRRKETEELMDIAKNLFSKQDAEGGRIESEIFSVEHSCLVLSFKAADGTDVTLLGDENGINFLSQDQYSLDYFKGEVEKKIQEVGLDGFVERLNAYLKKEKEIKLAKGEPLKKVVEQLNKVRDKYTIIKNKYFPEKRKKKK